MAKESRQSAYGQAQDQDVAAESTHADPSKKAEEVPSQKPKAKRKPRGRAMVRFMQGVDLRGKRDSRPGWGWLTVGFVVLVVAFVAGLRRGNVQGRVVAVVAVVLLVLWIVASFYVRYALFSHYDGSVLSRRERDALAGKGTGDEKLLRRASRVMSVGPLLARATRELPWGERSRLTPEEVQTIEQNRKSEAKLTAEWRESVGDLTKVSIVADDGILLVAHVLECAPESNRWVVLAHDYHGHWNEMLLYARSYAQRGFNLVVPEMRAHGESEGNVIGMGWLDRLDLIDWCRWIAANKNEQARIVLHGHSMGGVAACLAACDKLLPSGVLAAVVDSPYSDAWNMLTRVLRGCHLPVRPVAQMVRLLLMLTPGGYDLAEASAVHAVEHAQVPTLIIHGEKDTMVPPYMSKKTYDHVSGSASGDNSQLRMFPHAGHCQALLSDPKTYYHEVFLFLKPRV